MLTQTVTITQNSTPNIIIGRRSTYETQQVIFDISWFIETYGEGTAELLIKRPKDASAYPVVATLDGNALTWTVSETDTQDKGHGECEIYWYVNGGLAKSCICGITILRDIGDTTETAPDPYETWVDELARLGAETLANAQAAEQSATSAAQSATEADNSAAAALESEENALNSENAAKASEQAAAASKQGAEQSATAARQSATEADQSATNAHDDATDASASADRAEQAAASIEGDTERAEAAARTAQGAASDASRFAGTASTKATEAAGSAATAEQAASTATQEAADASASETAAAGSASSASASATAAGNAQTAAETAQGKAEDAQEAAETAAASVAGKSAQIDQNTAGLVELRSALNTKAGILRDTASGSVASFVPDSTVPNLLGLSVALEPIQDLHGYDSPWPAGGGNNKWDEDWEEGRLSWTGENYADSTKIRSKGFMPVIAGETYRIVTSSNIQIFYYNSDKEFVSYESSSKANQTTITIPTGCEYLRFYTYGTDYGTVYKHDIAINYPSTVTTYSPYSNICPISGRESVEVEADGVNLWHGQLANNANVVFDTKPGQTYTVSAQLKGSADCYLYVQSSDDGFVTTALVGRVIAAQNIRKVTFTAEAGKEYALWSNASYVEADKIQIELGSTATDYKPYVGTTYTIQLGETVYGGTLDVTNGTLTVDRAMVDLGTLNWSAHASLSSVYAGNGSSLPKWLIVWPAGTASAICSSYVLTKSSVGGVDAIDCSIALGTGGSTSIYVHDSTVSDLTEFINSISGVQLCYKLTNPVEITLTPTQIFTIAGQTNNVWADAGDVAVEFAADLKTYIDQKIAAAVAALS